jgi:hypothetical protein
MSVDPRAVTGGQDVSLFILEPPYVAEADELMSRRDIRVGNQPLRNHSPAAHLCIDGQRLSLLQPHIQSRLPNEKKAGTAYITDAHSVRAQALYGYDASQIHRNALFCAAVSRLELEGRGNFF